MNKMYTLKIINKGDDPIRAGDMVYCCPCCEETHGVNSDCEQGQRA